MAEPEPAQLQSLCVSHYTCGFQWGQFCSLSTRYIWQSGDNFDCHYGVVGGGEWGVLLQNILSTNVEKPCSIGQTIHTAFFFFFLIYTKQSNSKSSSILTGKKMKLPSVWNTVWSVFEPLNLADHTLQKWFSSQDKLTMLKNITIT